MKGSDANRRVSWLGVGIAFLVPLVVAGLAAALVGQAGPHHVRLIGVPRDELHSLEAASEGEADVSERAIEIATVGVRGTSEGRVRDIALARYLEDPLYAFSGACVGCKPSG